MTHTDCLSSDTPIRRARRTPRTLGPLSGAILAGGAAFAVAAFGIAFSLAIMSGGVAGASTTLLGIMAWMLLSIGTGCALAARATTCPEATGRTRRPR